MSKERRKKEDGKNRRNTPCCYLEFKPLIIYFLQGDKGEPGSQGPVGAIGSKVCRL